MVLHSPGHKRRRRRKGDKQGRVYTGERVANSIASLLGVLPVSRTLLESLTDREGRDEKAKHSKSKSKFSGGGLGFGLLRLFLPSY